MRELRHRPVVRGPRDRSDGVLDRAADGLLALCFPDTCVACGEPLARRRDYGVCGACWRRVADLELEPPWCPSCGIPSSASSGAGEVCIPCLLEPPCYSGARAVGYYAGELRALIRALKFDQRRDLRYLLAPRLAAACLSEWRPGDLDAVVPVPLHPTRQRERGFNQAALLARTLAPYLGLPCAEHVLRRAQHTRPQVGLSLADRLRNVRGAFRASGRGALRGLRILLVDDVMTTGATVSSAAAALLEGGALRVSVVSVARAVDGID